MYVRDIDTAIEIRESTDGSPAALRACVRVDAHRGAAAVGDKPGVTQSLDFYRIGSRSKYVRLFMHAFPIVR